jgi:thioredoxin 1
MSTFVNEVTESSFEEKVLKSEKPVLVDFWAPWCGPCLALAPTIDVLAQENTEKVAFVKVNVDENPKIATAFGIRGIPTLLLFSEGKEVERLIGLTNKETIAAILEKYAEIPTAA